MKTIEEISEFVQNGAFELSRHALARMLERNISEAELKESFVNAEIIEDYPMIGTCQVVWFWDVPTVRETFMSS